MKVREMCLTALMTALICVAAPLTVPVGVIPVSLATLAVYLAGALLGSKRGVMAVALYLLIGAVGVPVYAGFGAGIQKLVGVTGGYLWGYLPCAAVVGFAADRARGRGWMLPVSMILGTAICYGLGTAWFMLQMRMGLAESLASCVLPFLPGDAVKIVLASAAVPVLRRKLKIQQKRNRMIS